MNQTETILHHLTHYGPITQADAFELYGIFRLASRISDLKRFGFQVEKEMVTGKNRYGKTVTFARYSMKGDNNA